MYGRYERLGSNLHNRGIWKREAVRLLLPLMSFNLKMTPLLVYREILSYRSYRTQPNGYLLYIYYSCPMKNKNDRLASGIHEGGLTLSGTGVGNGSPLKNTLRTTKFRQLYITLSSYKMSNFISNDVSLYDKWPGVYTKIGVGRIPACHRRES